MRCESDFRSFICDVASSKRMCVESFIEAQLRQTNMDEYEMECREREKACVMDKYNNLPKLAIMHLFSFSIIIIAHVDSFGLLFIFLLSLSLLFTLVTNFMNRVAKQHL